MFIKGLMGLKRWLCHRRWEAVGQVDGLRLIQVGTGPAQVHAESVRARHSGEGWAPVAEGSAVPLPWGVAKSQAAPQRPPLG